MTNKDGLRLRFVKSANLVPVDGIDVLSAIGARDRIMYLQGCELMCKERGRLVDGKTLPSGRPARSLLVVNGHTPILAIMAVTLKVKTRNNVVPLAYAAQLIAIEKWLSNNPPILWIKSLSRCRLLGH